MYKTIFMAKIKQQSRKIGSVRSVSPERKNLQPSKQIPPGKRTHGSLRMIHMISQTYFPVRWKCSKPFGI